ncbi:unnamed protein product [Periconia digitata]|uniref:Uncharacterized protein n=1 Tax=Periconia digitata TaxID=1303443 RepID=A0A9W4UL44_9PLEO|nr:unnamed protein product [Periconia digitata]
MSTRHTSSRRKAPEKSSGPKKGDGLLPSPPTGGTQDNGLLSRPPPGGTDDGLSSARPPTGGNAMDVDPPTGEDGPSRSRVIRDLLEDDSFLKKIEWSEESAPALSVQERVKRGQEQVSQFSASVEAWRKLSDAEKVCAECGQSHPPPCLSEEERNERAAIRHLLARYHRVKMKEEREENPLETSCKRCAKMHRGPCKTPQCGRCKRYHKGNESCEAAEKRFVAAGLEENPQDEENYQKFKNFFGAIGSDTAAVAGRLFVETFEDKSALMAGRLFKETFEDKSALMADRLFKETFEGGSTGPPSKRKNLPSDHGGRGGGGGSNKRSRN